MGRVFLFGAYKYPRELTWILGVLLVASASPRASPATCCRGTRPRTGRRRSGSTSTARRRSSARSSRSSCKAAPTSTEHAQPVLLDPHADPAGDDHRADRAAPVSRDPARRHLAAVVEGGRRLGAAPAALDRLEPDGSGLPPPRRAGSSGARMANDRSPSAGGSSSSTRRTSSERGKPFFPGAMLHDTMMSLVVVVVIIGLAVSGSGRCPGITREHRHRGSSGSSSTSRPTRARSSFVPRPDWYFYFLFYLLGSSSGRDRAPRDDRDPDDPAAAPDGAAVHRRAAPSGTRPAARSRWSPRSSSILSMGVLTYHGATAKEALGSELVRTSRLGREGGLRGTRRPSPERRSSPRSAA